MHVSVEALVTLLSKYDLGFRLSLSRQHVALRPQCEGTCSKLLEQLSGPSVSVLLHNTRESTQLCRRLVSGGHLKMCSSYQRPGLSKKRRLDYLSGILCLQVTSDHARLLLGLAWRPVVFTLLLPCNQNNRTFSFGSILTFATVCTPSP